MDSLAIALLLAGGIQKAIQHLRTAIPAIDGLAVLVLSTALGVATAAGTDVRLLAALTPTAEVAGWLDLMATGYALGAGAGFIADISGRSGTGRTL